MALRIAINGFGRIGRNILRASWNDPSFEIVHINDLTSNDMLAYLLQHDTVHRTFASEVKAVEGGITVDGTFIEVTSIREPASLPWAAKKIDIVLECTGLFRGKDSAGAHIKAGARKVIISAPGQSDIDGTFVLGVNHQDLDPSKHHIVSNASCTTNCLAPLAKVIHEVAGIQAGIMTTVHSYTMDQNLLDGAHRKGKMRRARAAAQNMVPTTTGAAAAIGLVMPELAGKLDGMAIRVPTPNVSLVDLTFTAQRDTTVEALNNAIIEAAAGPMKGVLAHFTTPLVSSDLIGNPNSSIVDLSLTKVMDKRLVKVLSWYDNEWGFSNRMIDLAKLLGA